MNRKKLFTFLNISLIICIFVGLFVLPVLYTKAQGQYSAEMRPIMALEVKKAMILWEIEQVKAEIISLMSEMVTLMSESFDELMADFNEYFELVPGVEDVATSTATTTATTTEEVEESSLYQQNQGPVLTSPPIVCDPVAYGRQTYNVSTKSVPRISQIIVDPLDLAFNATMDVIVSINDANQNPITSVTGIANTDIKKTPFSLSLTDGTETNGTWQGSWTLNDSICMNFVIEINASSNSGTSKVVVTFR